MEAWYPCPVPPFQIEMSSASCSPTNPGRPRKVSQPAAHAEYHLSSTISSPSSQRSSHSPPPLSVTYPVETDSHYHHDPELYGYLAHQSHGVSISASSGEQLQYHQWEINQLMGSSQAPSRHISNYTPTGSLAAEQRYDSYMVSYEPPHVENDSISGYASSSSPPSIHLRRSISTKHNHQTNFEKNYAVIHHAFKPMSIDPRPIGHHLSNDTNYHFKNSQQPHFSNFVSISQFESMGPARKRPSPKKMTKENVKRFPCPDCGRMFARAFNMETHRKTHIGYRPHGCPKCSKSFSRRHDLHRHLSAVHNDHKKIPLVTSIPVPPEHLHPVTS